MPGSLACPERSRRDPQIVRFLGVDPLADAQGQQIYSPYAAMGNMPESTIDPNGMAITTYTGSDAQALFAILQNASVGGTFVNGQFRSYGDVSKQIMAAVMQGVSGCSVTNEYLEGASKGFFNQTMGIGSGGGDGQFAGNDGDGGRGVDYTFNGTSISNETVANGLDYNRIVTRNKKGEVKGNVSIGDNYLNNQATAALVSKYLFINFADGAIDVWFFLANRSRNEWTLTEFKLDNTVFSRITSVGNNMQGGGVMERQEVDGRNGLSYWISVHNHPQGGNGLSDNGNGMDDNTTIGHIRNTYYRGAQMNAYDYAHLADAYDFIKNNRK